MTRVWTPLLAGCCLLVVPVVTWISLLWTTIPMMTWNINARSGQCTLNNGRIHTYACMTPCFIHQRCVPHQDTCYDVWVHVTVDEVEESIEDEVLLESHSWDIPMEHLMGQTRPCYYTRTHIRWDLYHVTWRLAGILLLGIINVYIIVCVILATIWTVHHQKVTLV